VRIVKAAATRRSGKEPVLRGDAYWTDCALLAAAGIPTVMLGPTGHGAHAAVEWVDEASVHTVAAS
jgi:acetylornithine deacetylase